MGRAYQNRKDSMAKTSDAKAKVYSKYGRAIYVCAKAGGLDPSGNLTLRSLIQRAKKDQVPTHVIDKAIEKAKGGAGENFELARYEGYGPGNCMVIIECLTAMCINSSHLSICGFLIAAFQLSLCLSSLYHRAMPFLCSHIKDRPRQSSRCI